ncbi:MAG: gliding motility-associated C-terminal domain-containing protein [Ferruginibacter sp.]
MKSKLIFFFILFCGNKLFAQQLSLKWANAFSVGYATATTKDISGNVYTSGILIGTADLDPGPAVYNLTSAGYSDVIIVKYDPLGNFIWAKQISNNYILLNDGARAIGIDGFGNVYLTGFFTSTCDFDPGPGVFNLTCTQLGGYAAYLLKLDGNGNFVWANKLAESSPIAGNSGYSITTAASGNVYVTGLFTGTADFDPGPAVYNISATGSDQDVFISKFDNNGSFLWAKHFSGYSIVCHSITVDAQENVYAAGLIYGICDFDPGPGVYNLNADPGWSDAFISKLDFNGNFVWAKQITGSFHEINHGIALDNFGNVYVAGEFASPTDFDPGPGTYLLNPIGVNRQGFILKLNPAGDFVWAKQFEGTGDCQSYSIAVDHDNAIYACGPFSGDIDFDPGPAVYQLSATSSFSIFIVKLLNDGSFVFATRIGGTENTAALSMALDNLKNIYLSGWFNGTTDFDPDISTYNLTASPQGGFTVKLSQCAQNTNSLISVNACNSYTLNGQTYFTSGTYNQSLLNSFGCDSTIELQLTIGGSINTNTVVACDSYLWEGQTYTVSGNYSVTLTGADGCDSILNLNLTIKQSSSSTINISICEGQNYAGHNTTGTFIDNYVAANGCDSIRTLHLTIIPAAHSFYNAVICEGENYWGYNQTGTYSDNFPTANGCDSIRTLNLLVNPKSSTSVSASICDGENYFAGGANQTVSGIYKDTLNNYLGCDSIITTSLIVNPKPNPQLGGDKDICNGTSIILNPGTFSQYEWQDLSSSPTFSISEAGIYWVQVTDMNNCTSTDSIRINNLLPIPSDFLKPLDYVCEFEKIQLTATNVYTHYLWSNGSEEPAISINQPGNYILTVRDGAGCSGSDTITIVAKDCIEGIFIPNAFTPNGDNINDLFKVKIFGELISFQLEIFNRWGEKIFSTNNPNQGWDGNINRGNSDMGVYIWQCHYQLRGPGQVIKRVWSR